MERGAEDGGFGAEGGLDLGIDVEALVEDGPAGNAGGAQTDSTARPCL